MIVSFRYWMASRIKAALWYKRYDVGRPRDCYWLTRGYYLVHPDWHLTADDIKNRFN